MHSRRSVRAFKDEIYSEVDSARYRRNQWNDSVHIACLIGSGHGKSVGRSLAVWNIRAGHLAGKVSSSGKRTVAQARNSKNAREKLYRLLLCGSGKQDGMDHGNGLCKTRPAQRFEKYAAFIIRQTASATFCGCCLFLYPSPGNDHVCTGQLFIWCDNFWY